MQHCYRSSLCYNCRQKIKILFYNMQHHTVRNTAHCYRPSYVATLEKYKIYFITCNVTLYYTEHNTATDLHYATIVDKN